MSDTIRESPPRTEPSLWLKAANYTRALAQHLVSGGVHVTDDVRQQRLAICQDCPSCDRERLVCLEPVCGCELQIKARWASSRCPLGNW